MSQERIMMIPPEANGGWPGNYNWFGANEVKVIGRYTKGNKDTGNLNNQKVFAHISDSDWMTPIPKYNIGQQDNDHAKKDIYYVSACNCGSYVRDNISDYTKNKSKKTVHGKPKFNDKNDLAWLFREGGWHQRGFISDWNGHYGTSSSNWYQTNGFSVYNSDKNTVYPFAVKGIAFTIRVPVGSSGLDAWGFVAQHGKYCQINYMHGLWMDENKKFYSYEMMPNGDNVGKAKVSKLREPYWNGDPATTHYYFLRDAGKGKSSFTRKYFPDEDMAIKIRAIATAPEIEDLYFVGFSCLIKTFNDGTENRSHTIQFSNVAPIPFFSPRPPLEFNHRVVMGEPTPLDSVKAGYAKIHYDNGRDPYGFQTNGTDWVPDGEAPGYGDDQEFGDIPPEYLPQPETGDTVGIQDVESNDLREYVYTDEIVVTGIDGLVNVTAEGGSAYLSLNNEDWVLGTNGIIIAKDEQFRVRLRVPSKYDETISTDVTVGGNDPITWTVKAGIDEGPTTPYPFEPWKSYTINANTWWMHGPETNPGGIFIKGISEPVPIKVETDALKFQIQASNSYNWNGDWSPENQDSIMVEDGMTIDVKVVSPPNAGEVYTTTITVGDSDPQTVTMTAK